MWIHWPFFPKTCTKGHWPLDNLWPHVCWGHMCDSTQGSLCPSPMTIHQCMWIQWSILQKITTYIHIHTYKYYIQNEWSHSLLLNSVQARQKLQHRVQKLTYLVIVYKYVDEAQNTGWWYPEMVTVLASWHAEITIRSNICKLYNSSYIIFVRIVNLIPLQEWM